MTVEQALLAEKIIDSLHNPSWSVAFVFTLFFVYETYVLQKKGLIFQSATWFQKVKVFLIYWFAGVALTQAIFGGCVIHIPQNWIAREYLNREYWHPYGLVYRELFPSWFIPIMRFMYLPVGVWLVSRARVLSVFLRQLR